MEHNDEPSATSGRDAANGTDAANGADALSTALAVWYYHRYRHLLHRLKRDLSQYGDLQ